MHSYRAGQSALLSFLISVCYALSCLIVSVMFLQQTMAEMGEDVLEEHRRGICDFFCLPLYMYSVSQKIPP